MNNDWKYVKKLENQNLVKDFLKENDISLPNEIIAFIEKNNNGRPLKPFFNTQTQKEQVFKSLLSYNKNDLDNIYDIYDNEINLLPFATDSAGNIIFIDLIDFSIKFTFLETDKVEVLAKSLQEFLDDLYDD